MRFRRAGAAEAASTTISEYSRLESHQKRVSYDEVAPIVFPTPVNAGTVVPLTSFAKFTKKKTKTTTIATSAKYASRSNSAGERPVLSPLPSNTTLRFGGNSAKSDASRSAKKRKRSGTAQTSIESDYGADTLLANQPSRSSASPAKQRRRSSFEIYTEEVDNDTNEQQIPLEQRTAETEGHLLNETQPETHSILLEGSVSDDNDSRPKELLTRDVLEFQYPTEMPIPTAKTLRHFCRLATTVDDAGEAQARQHNIPDSVIITTPKTMSEQTATSHQLQLQRAGSKLLSTEDVIIPSIATEQNKVLKAIQAKAQRHASAFPGAGGSDAVELIRFSRLTLQNCALAAARAVKDARLERTEAQRQARIAASTERRLQKEQDRAARRLANDKERQRRAAELAQAKQIKKERRKFEQKKNWPKNKELWREVALLMTDLARLQKEKKIWSEDAAAFLDKMEADLENCTVLQQQQKKQQAQPEECSVVGDTQETTFMASKPQTDLTVLQQTVDDITLAAKRINMALQEVVTTTKNSDDIRKKLHEKYKEDHKFHGYRGASDPKALIRALAFT